MLDWFKKKDEVEILETRYRTLMRKSYKLAIAKKEESQRVRWEASQILEKIEFLNMQIADK